MGGSRRAMTDVDLGIIVVSSSYSVLNQVSVDCNTQEEALPTFIAILVVNGEIKLGPIAKSALDDDFTFQVKYGNASPIEFDARWFLLGLKLEEHRGGHLEWSGEGYSWLLGRTGAVNFDVKDD
jgi:hypothetical protein